MSLEMIRIRVLFLEPGDKVYPSSLEDCVTDFAVMQSKMKAQHVPWEPGDYEAEGFYAMSREVDDVSDSLSGFLGSPNDPTCVMLKPLTAVYFDLLTVNSDWHGGGGIGSDVEAIGLFDTFESYVLDFIVYARRVKLRRSLSKDAFGTKVQFMTMWSYWATQDYFGEWDSGSDFVGVFDESDVETRPLDAAESLVVEEKSTLIEI